MWSAGLVFSSLLFIFVFLALNLVAYSAVGKKWRNLVLLGFSLVFYGWAGPQYLLLLAADTLVAWGFGLGLGKAQEKGTRKALLAISVCLLVGALFAFKYLGMVVGTWQAAFGFPEEVSGFVLPLGISVFTLQLVSYVTDVYRNDIEPQRAYWKLLLYSSLFHYCVAGPIVRYAQIADRIDERKFTRSGFFVGVRRFSVGLAKKVLLADACGAAAKLLLPETAELIRLQSASGLWLGMLFFALQVYLDLSAYADMAIGLGRIAGFSYPENFNYPYMCSSVSDFWHRWLISLTTFVRDYVYIPRGGSRTSTAKVVRNCLVAWLLIGLWHGTTWNYVLWGLYFFLFAMLEKFVIKGRLPKVLGHVLSLLVVFFGWVLFRYGDMGELGCLLAGMFGRGSGGAFGLQAKTVLFSNCVLLAFSIVACTDLGVRIRSKWVGLAAKSALAFRILTIVEVATPLVLVIVSAACLVGNDLNPFLFFRF